MKRGDNFPLNTEKKKEIGSMKVPVLVVKVPLYQVDDEGTPRRLTEEEYDLVMEVMEEISRVEDIAGWTISQYEVVEMEIDDQELY